MFALDAEIAAAHEKDIEYEKTHFYLGTPFAHIERLKGFAGPLLLKALEQGIVRIEMPSEYHAPRFVIVKPLPDPSMVGDWI